MPHTMACSSRYKVKVSEDTGSDLSPDLRHGWANLSDRKPKVSRTTTKRHR